MKVIKNRSKMLLTVNLGGGKSVHLRPKDVTEISDVQVGHSEVVKHLARGRLVLVDAPKKADPKPVKAKADPPPAKAETKPDPKADSKKDDK